MNTGRKGNIIIPRLEVLIANKKLLKALTELDKLLAKKQIALNIFICGAFAIELLGFERVEPTIDADSATPITNKEVLELIKAIGEARGLGSRWLNDQASTVAIPEGAVSRASSFGSWRNIKAILMDRSDLIKMKSAAFSTRRDETLKDWEDLKLMKPTAKEMYDAIAFLRATRSPPTNATRRIIEEFNETVDDLKKLAVE